MEEDGEILDLRIEKGLPVPAIQEVESAAVVVTV